VWVGAEDAAMSSGIAGPPADLPFRVGQRVRCRAHTYTGDASLRADLYGRAGTVVAVGWNEPWGGKPRWEVRVNYDHLGQLTAPRN
jgi:hypothetical protein